MSTHPLGRDDASGISFTTVDGSTWITLHGEVDAALRDQASEAMVFLMVQNAPVVLDVGAVTFIDSSGLAFLVQVYRVCEESGIDVELLDPTPNMLDLLDVLGMTDRFAIRRSDEDGTARAGA
jgi:anti-sigma B factor antagonist